MINKYLALLWILAGGILTDYAVYLTAGAWPKPFSLTSLAETAAMICFSVGAVMLFYSGFNR